MALKLVLEALSTHPLNTWYRNWISWLRAYLGLIQSESAKSWPQSRPVLMQWSKNLWKPDVDQTINGKGNYKKEVLCSKLNFWIGTFVIFKIGSWLFLFLSKINFFPGTTKIWSKIGNFNFFFKTIGLKRCRYWKHYWERQTIVFPKQKQFTLYSI
jgi:hypothetical protein